MEKVSHALIRKIEEFESSKLLTSSKEEIRQVLPRMLRVE